MNKFTPQYSQGDTPLDPNEVDGLIPDYVTTQRDLNLLEQQNILEGKNWAEQQKMPNVLSTTFCYKLHKHMFGNVWNWAGISRKTDKNIGCHWIQIPSQLHKLFKDVSYWIKLSVYKWDEIAARFHHRLVLIHAFVNGNGRHARLMTDILLKTNNCQPFTWGKNTYKNRIETDSSIREAYLSALKKANKNDFVDLIQFVRS